MANEVGQRGSLRARRRSGGRIAWSVQFRMHGQIVSETFDDEATARKFQRLLEQVGPAAARALRDGRGEHTRNVPTLEEWLEHHLSISTGITAGTVGEYRRLAARTFLPSLGSYPIDAITRDMIKVWIGQQARVVTNRGTPTSPKTIANAHGLLSSLFASAIEAGHRGDNPSRGVRLPRAERGEMCFLTHNEFALLLAEIPPADQLFVSLLAGTGLRWGEATALQWTDMDLHADVPSLRVARAWQRAETGTRVLGAPKTARSRRTVSLPTAVVEQLRAVQAADGFVFTAPQGGPLRHQAWHPRVWLPAVERSRIGKRPRIHDLRHTHASWLIAEGVPLPVIQRRLGHESIQTTVDVYGHLAEGAGELAARAADIALAGAMPAIEG